MLTDVWLVSTDSPDLSEQILPSLDEEWLGEPLASLPTSSSPLPALDLTVPEDLQELDELDLEYVGGEGPSAVPGADQSASLVDSFPLAVTPSLPARFAAGTSVENPAESAWLWSEQPAVNASQTPPTVSSPRATITAFALTAATVISYLVLSGAEPSRLTEVPSASSDASATDSAHAQDPLTQGARTTKYAAGRVSEPTPALVSIPITSNDGAVVTLVDNGRVSVLGPTPLSVTIDASAEYDLVVTKPATPTRILHLDRATTKQGAINIDASPASPR
jgi:hypothetical protein